MPIREKRCWKRKNPSAKSGSAVRIEHPKRAWLYLEQQLCYVSPQWSPSRSVCHFGQRVLYQSGDHFLCFLCSRLTRSAMHFEERRGYSPMWLNLTGSELNPSFEPNRRKSLILAFLWSLIFENTIGWLLILKCNAIIVIFAIDYYIKPDPTDLLVLNSMGYRKNKFAMP